MTRRALIITPLLIASWYAMMLVHELGHVVATWATGSRVDAVHVPWVGFSQTLVPTTQWPRTVTSSGPIVGTLLPLFIWLAVRHIPRLARRGWSVIARFLATFCLLANGVYIGSALLSPVGDAEELVRLGVPAWALTALGLPAAAFGIAVWNGIAKNIHDGNRVDAPHSRATLRQSLVFLVCVLVVALLC